LGDKKDIRFMKRPTGTSTITKVHYLRDWPRLTPEKLNACQKNQKVVVTSKVI